MSDEMLSPDEQTARRGKPVEYRDPSKRGGAECRNFAGSLFAANLERHSTGRARR